MFSRGDFSDTSIKTYISEKCNGNSVFAFTLCRSLRTLLRTSIQRQINIINSLDTKPRKAKLILGNIAGQDFTRITACALHNNGNVCVSQLYLVGNLEILLLFCEKTAQETQLVKNIMCTNLFITLSIVYFESCFFFKICIDIFITRSIICSPLYQFC